MGELIPALPPRQTLRGHDAYCHVCWEEVYQLWAEDEPPDYERCPLGPYTAQSCPNAKAGAHAAKLAQLVDERALELWRERELSFPARSRRMHPNDLDRASGAWDLIRKRAFHDVLFANFNDGGEAVHTGTEGS